MRVQTAKPSAFHVGLQAKKATDNDTFNLLALSIAWILMVVLAHPVGEFALNDDWVYAQAVKSVLDSGRYQFPAISSANVGPQIYWGALFCLPFGFSFTALRLSTLVMAWLGLLLFYRLARVLNCTGPQSLLAASAMAVNPLYFLLSNTFMTDVPFVVSMIAAILAFLIGLQRDSKAALTWGVVLSFVSILIRQFGEVLPLAFAVALLVHYGVSLKRLIAVASMIFAAVALHLIYQYWIVHSGRVPSIAPHSDIRGMISTTMPLRELRQSGLKIISYVGFLVLPVLSIAWFRAAGTPAGRPKLRAIAVVLGVLLFLVLWKAGLLLPSSGNVLTPTGAGPLTLTDTYVMWINHQATPKPLKAVWWLVTLAASVAAVVVFLQLGEAAWKYVAVSAGHRPVENRATALLLLAATALHLVLLAVFAYLFYVFDRYVLPLLPLLLLLIFYLNRGPTDRSSKLRFSTAIVVTVVFAGYSVAITHDYLAWNRARWSLADTLMTSRGVASSDIDGGYEFNGWHRYAADYVVKAGKSPWWVANEKYLISSGPVPGYSEVLRQDVPRWLAVSHPHVLVVEKIIEKN